METTTIILLVLTVGVILFLLTRKQKKASGITSPQSVQKPQVNNQSNIVHQTPPKPRHKPKSATTTGKFMIAGYHHLPEDVRRMVWKELKENDNLTLVPVDNPYDREAVSVRFNNTHIGWIPKDCRRKKEIYNALSECREVTAVCVSNKRRQDTLRASRPDENGKWNDIFRQAQFVEVKFTKERD